MRSCAYLEEVEELAIGSVTGARARRARAHLASCAGCREAHAYFVEERALFAHRAALFDPPPDLPAVVMGSSPRRAWRPGRASGAWLAVAACAAAVVGIARFDGAGEGDPSRGAVEPIAQRAMSRESIDEPVACAFPASGFVYTRDEPSACTTSANATCEEAVTSSVAGP